MNPEKIPADPKKKEEEAVREQQMTDLKSEYMQILQELPEITTRLNELEMISDVIRNRIYDLTTKKESMELRRDALREMIEKP